MTTHSVTIQIHNSPTSGTYVWFLYLHLWQHHCSHVNCDSDMQHPAASYDIAVVQSHVIPLCDLLYKFPTGKVNDETD